MSFCLTEVAFVSVGTVAIDREHDDHGEGHGVQDTMGDEELGCTGACKGLDKKQTSDGMI